MIREAERQNRPDNEDAIRGIEIDRQKSDYEYFCELVTEMRDWLSIAKGELNKGNLSGVIDSIDELLPHFEEFLEENKDKIIEV